MVVLGFFFSFTFTGSMVMKDPISPLSLNAASAELSAVLKRPLPRQLTLQWLLLPLFVSWLFLISLLDMIMFVRRTSPSPDAGKLVSRRCCDVKGHRRSSVLNRSSTYLFKSPALKKIEKKKNKTNNITHLKNNGNGIFRLMTSSPVCHILRLTHLCWIKSVFLFGRDCYPFFISLLHQNSCFLWTTSVLTPLQLTVHCDLCLFCAFF